MSFELDQMALISAINKEICRQHPKMPLESRLFNAVIAAANGLVEEFAKPIVEASEGMGLQAWLNSDDTGASSLYMAYCLSGGQLEFWAGREEPEYAYPRDPDDLGRCIRLIEAVPEFGGKIAEMSHRGARWLTVTTNWADWVGLYEGDYTHTLYDEMKAAYGEK